MYHDPTTNLKFDRGVSESCEGADWSIDFNHDIGKMTFVDREENSGPSSNLPYDEMEEDN